MESVLRIVRAGGGEGGLSWVAPGTVANERSLKGAMNNELQG